MGNKKRSQKYAQIIFSALVLTVAAGDALAVPAKTTYTCVLAHSAYGYDNVNDQDGSLGATLNDRSKNKSSFVKTLIQDFAADGMDVLRLDNIAYRRPIPFGNVFYHEDGYLGDLIIKLAFSNDPISEITLIHLNADSFGGLNGAFYESEMWQCTITDVEPETPVSAAAAAALGFERMRLYTQFVNDLADVSDGCPGLLNGTITDFSCE